ARDLADITLVGHTVGQALSIRTTAGEVHRQGDVAALRPQFRPLRERGSTAAVDQDHRGQFALNLFGPREVGEDSCGLTGERYGLVVELPHRASVFDPRNFWSFLQRLDVPGADVFIGARDSRAECEHND